MKMPQKNKTWIAVIMGVMIAALIITMVIVVSHNTDGFSLTTSLLSDQLGFNKPIPVDMLMLCVVTALILGLAISLSYYFSSNGKCTKSFISTLVLLPFIVQMILMLSSRNLGVSIAVAGTFALVRFRSVPGTAREIIYVMLCMVTGFMCSMGFAYLAVFAAMIGIITNIILRFLRFGRSEGDVKDLRIIVPESLNFTGTFDELLNHYTSFWELTRVKTTNMGSMYSLQYRVVLKQSADIKGLLDDIRTRNGNLTVSICDVVVSEGEQL